MKILFSPGLYTDAEREALQWLAERAKWLNARVRRRSPREFDLAVEGEFDADDGYDGPPVMQIGAPVKRQFRGHAKVKPQRFASWFPLGCLHAWWKMGLHKPVDQKWDNTRDMLEQAKWAEFERILELAKSKPLFSTDFIRCLETVWQGIGSEAECDDNAEAIEMCLDANRLETFNEGEEGKRAEAELDWLDARFTPQVVAAELERQVRLV